MKLSLLAVTNRIPDWLAEGCEEYIKRLPREFSFQVFEIKPEARTTGKTREQLMAAEAQRVRAALPAGSRFVALDERGRDLTTKALAERLTLWQNDGRDVCLVIGGPDGLDPALKVQADESLRLSSLTLPHALARLFLCEQIYRASSILNNHPYHRE